MRKPLLAVVLLVSLTACNRKPKLEGKVTGFKPGSTSVVMVHAKATKGSHVWCGPGGHSCEPFDIPASGEKDVEVDLSKGSYDTGSKVMLTATYRDKNKEVLPLDLAASVPPALEVMSYGGYVSCKPRECSGSIDVMASSAKLFLPAGSTFQLGTSKVTANASGAAQGPVTLTPAPKDVLLSKVCTLSSDKATLGTMPASLTFPDKTTSTSKFELTTETLTKQLIAALEGAKKGPVPFAWESSGATTGKPAAVVMRRTYCHAGGPADATVKDVRVVVFGEDKPRSGTCNYVFTDGTRGTANLTMHDELATAYERTTGKVLGTKLFVAKKYCDPEVTSKTKSLKGQDEYADYKAIAAWATTLAR